MLSGRQLCTIMFTDIEGYTATMQESEQKAIALRARHREVLHQAHEQFNGHIVQYYGDGTLSIFQSAVEAVGCALSMQQSFCKSPQVPVRIGLHMGDVIIDDEQVVGDGVNLASRIESLGVAGSVLLSDKVQDEISNHPEFKTVSVGTYQLKNVSHPVEVFALNHDGLVKPQPGSLKGKTELKKNHTSASVRRIPAKSVAVIPFVNISNDPNQDYFSCGISEEILNSLSNLKDLKVAGRIPSLHYDRENTSLQEIGEKLGVRTVLEGSVQKQGNRLRITVQLVNVSDGFHLWSEKYDRSMDDIFAIQDEVALAVTEKLKVTLLEKDRAKITRNSTRNTEAYELYLKGRFYLTKRGDSIMTSMHYFQLAIDIDSGFALAYAGFADASLMCASYGLMSPKKVAYKARDAAETALKLDPSLCEPYCSLGYYYTIFEWDWINAEKHFKTCIELNPTYAQAHYMYGLNYLAWVKHDLVAAEKHGQRAVELEPLSSICFGGYGGILHAAGKFKEALAACNTGIELDADCYLCILYKGWAHLAMRQFDEALLSFSHMMKVSHMPPYSQNGLILTYLGMGNIDKARELQNELKIRAEGEYTGYALTGLATAFLDGIDKAFPYFEKGYEERDPVMLTLKYTGLATKELREDSRFQLLLERIGFP